jgi:hypothetical protein
VVESTALEMRRACEGTVGSNPTLSATMNLGLPALQSLKQLRLFRREFVV